MQTFSLGASIVENLSKLKDVFLVDDEGQVIELLIVHYIFSNESPKEFIHTLIKMTNDNLDNEMGEEDSSVDYQKYAPKLKYNPFGGDNYS